MSDDLKIPQDPTWTPVSVLAAVERRRLAQRINLEVLELLADLKHDIAVLRAWLADQVERGDR